MAGTAHVTDSKNCYKVSELASATGVAAATLRLWERHGLISPKRSSSKYRLYTEDDFARIHQIVRLRTVHGLNLAAIKAVLEDMPKSNGSKRNEPPEDEPRLGHAIRKLRIQKKISLTELAHAVGVSASTVSTFERTSRGASFPLLRDIAKFLGVTITQLTSSQKVKGRALVRRGEGSLLPSLGDGIQIRELASGPRMMDCQEWTIAPGASSEGFYAHEGEEFIRVLEGRFEIEIDGLGKATMEQGDSIYFVSDRQHAWRCLGRKACKLLWVNTPPTF
jgi:DNA-binding transcriptional MerR regulator/uncharacterized cupin superfamily protein